MGDVSLSADDVAGDAPGAPRRDILAAVLTMSAAVGVIGFVFGVGAVAAGASVAQTCVMSLLVFTGASQFSAVSVIASGGTAGAALGGAMVLAARNTVYGLALSRVVRGSLLRRLVAAHFTIDETTAMALAQERDEDKRHAFWATGLTLCLFWNTGGLVGALVGGSIDPQTFGLDVAFPAAYVAMVLPHLRHRRGLIAGALGVTICVALIPFTPVGVPILCAAAAILVGLPPETDPGNLPGNLPGDPSGERTPA